MMTQRRFAPTAARIPRNGCPLSSEYAKLLYELYDSKQKPVREIYETLGISKKTLYEYLKRRKGRDQIV
jgi:DNA invertase Pin-like site-specific DNA recombinase